MAAAAHPRWRQTLQVRAIRLALAALARLPLGAAQRIGACLGWLAAVLPTRSRHVSATNVALCFPRRAPEQRRRLVVASLTETGKLMAEAGLVWRWPLAAASRTIRRVAGAEHLNRALAAENGLLVMVPHLGNWELLNHFLASRTRITGFYQPPRIAPLDGALRHARERFGTEMVPTTGPGVRRLFEVLKGGGVAVLLPDQEPAPSAGIFVPFFGVPALTATLPARLALKTGAEVLVAFVKRLGYGHGFEVVVRAPVQLEPVMDAAVATERLTSDVEAAIRTVPEQYQWAYKRFKKRPPGGERVY